MTVTARSHTQRGATQRGVVGLSRVSIRLPKGTEKVDRILERAGHSLLERRIFAKFHGLRNSPTLTSGEPMEQLLVEAARDALGARGANVILYGHTQSVQDFACEPGFAWRLRSSLGLPEAGFYGVSHLNCVSVLRALEMARHYHARPASRPGERVLVLGGDHGSIADAARIVPRVTVAGDAAVAVIVHRANEEDFPRYRYLSGAALRDSRFHRSLRMTAKEQTLYSQSCVGHLAAALRKATNAVGMTFGDIDWIMPDLSSALFWRNFCRETGISQDRISLDLLSEQGHNNGVDALSALQHADETGQIRPGDRIALVALGQGAYFQVVIVEFTPEPL